MAPMGEKIMMLYIMIIEVPSIIHFLINLLSSWKLPIMNIISPTYMSKSYASRYVKNREAVFRPMKINRYFLFVVK